MAQGVADVAPATGRRETACVATAGRPRNDPVVLCAVAPALDRIRSRFPALEIVDVSHGVPDGVRGEVLFGGWGPHAVAAMSTGVRWVQLAGTGVDGVPSRGAGRARS